MHKPDNTLIIRSACCDATWELVYEHEAALWSLRCSTCLNAGHPNIQTTGPIMKQETFESEQKEARLGYKQLLRSKK